MIMDSGDPLEAGDNTSGLASSNPQQSMAQDLDSGNSPAAATVHVVAIGCAPVNHNIDDTLGGFPGINITAPLDSLLFVYGATVFNPPWKYKDVWDLSGGYAPSPDEYGLNEAGGFFLAGGILGLAGSYVTIEGSAVLWPLYTGTILAASPDTGPFYMGSGFAGQGLGFQTGTGIKVTASDYIQPGVWSLRVETSNETIGGVFTSPHSGVVTIGGVVVATLTAAGVSEASGTPNPFIANYNITVTRGGYLAIELDAMSYHKSNGTFGLVEAGILFVHP